MSLAGQWKINYDGTMTARRNDGQAGIIEPSPHLLVVWGDLDSPQVIVDQLKAFAAFVRR